MAIQIEGNEVEVVQAPPLSPSSYCYACGHLFKTGDIVRLVSRPIPIRYGKQRKKLKANTSYVLKQHKEGMCSK